MKILFIGNTNPDSGGPSNVMKGLKKYFDQSDDIKINFINIDKISFKNYIKLIFQKKLFEKKFLDSDVIHFHELWNPIVIYFINLAIKYFFLFKPIARILNS